MEELLLVLKRHHLSKDIYIFGCGIKGLEIYKSLSELEISIMGFIDNDKHKQGGKILDKKILSIEQIEQPGSFVIISTMNLIFYIQIKNQLEKLGFQENIDFCSLFLLENNIYKTLEFIPRKQLFFKKFQEEKGVLILYGAKDIGIRVLSDLKDTDLVVESFVDDDTNLQHTIIEGLSVISLGEMMQRYNEEKIFIIICENEVLIHKKIDILMTLNQQFSILEPDYMLYNEELTWNREKNKWIYNYAFNEDFYEERETVLFSNTISNGEYMALGDQDIPIFSHNGRADTVGFNAQAENSIHIFSSSILGGQFLKNEESVASILQLKINKYKKPYNVINHSASCQHFLFSHKKIMKMPSFLRQGDYVFVHINQEDYIQEFKNVSQQQIAYVIYELTEEINALCKENGSNLILVFLPRTEDIQNPSPVEYYINYIKTHCSGSYDDYIYNDIKLQTIDLETVRRLCGIYGVKFYDFIHDFNRPHALGEIFLDRTHLGPKGTKAVADRLYDLIFKCNLQLGQGNTENFNYIKSNIFNDIEKILQKDQKQANLEDYLNYLDLMPKSDNSGAIIMNCNPFTLGHRYLIEESAKEVNLLYVFILEEEKSEFTFAERFLMVKEGTKDISNVCVLSGGKFIISSITFPQYFQKSAFQKITDIDAAYDIEVFATKIAKRLDIKKRFVGHEPLCQITALYNEQLRKELPKNKIELIEKKRKKLKDCYISASLVRQALKEQRMEIVAELVPETTLQYLMQMNLARINFGG